MLVVPIIFFAASFVFMLIGALMLIDQLKDRQQTFNNSGFYTEEDGIYELNQELTDKCGEEVYLWVSK